MYNVSSEFLTAIKQNSRTVKASIGVGDKLITNIIANSDYSNGITGWYSLSSNISVIDNELTLLPTSTDGQVYTSTNGITGHIYYSRILVKSTSSKVYFSSYNNRKYHSGSGKYEVLSVLFKHTSGNINTGVVDSSPIGFVNSKIKQVSTIDLTEIYGYGNEPSQIYMDELFSKVGHFNGSTTVPLKFLDDRTLTNALQNGNMVDTTKWTGSNSIISSASNKLSIVGTGSNSVIGAYNSTSIKPSIGSMVYVKATITSLTSLSNNIVVKLMDGTSGNIILSKTLKSPKAETSYVVTGMINIKYNFVDNLTFVVDSSYSNTTDSNSASFTVEKVTVMDITSLYGVGKEPSLAYIDSIMKSQAWFNSKQVSILETGEPTVISNFDIESSFGNNNLPTLGSTVSNKFTMSMVNDLRIQQVFVDTTLRPYISIDIGSGQYEWIPLGEFYAEDSDIVSTKLNTTIDALDRMANYDELVYYSNISYPATVDSIMAEIKSNYGIKYNSDSILPNITFRVKNTGKTVREIIGNCASYMTTNATMNEYGEVEFKKIKSTGFKLGASNYSDFKLTSDVPISITKLVMTNSYGNTPSSVGDTSGFTLEFENDNISPNDLRDIVFKRQFPLTYTAYDMKVQGMPHLQIGDTFEFTDVNGVVRTLIIINHKLIFNGGLRSEFKIDTPKSNSTITTPTGGSTVTKAVDQSTNNMKKDLSDTVQVIDGKLLLKVDKVTGKSLVSDTEITKLLGVSEGANKVLDSTINGNILIDGVETNVYSTPTGTNPYGTTKSDVGLSNVDNTSDLLKPISNSTQTALNSKVDKVTGKSLLLDTEITKLTGVSIGANKVTASTTNGNILIDGVETNVYYIQSGTTTQRPTPTYIGQTHFDTTLGKPIWCKTISPIVWVDSTGTTV